MQENGSDFLTLFAVSALLILVIIIFTSIFLISYQKKVVSQKLQIQRNEIETQQKLLQASIDAQEKERKRIASDLHDDIGSLLSALKLNIRHLKSIHQVTEQDRNFLDQTATMLDEGLANVRRISYDLLPPTLARFGLWKALKELIKRANDSEQIQIISNLESMMDYRLDKRSELSLFRVLQELISNTLHHSKATEITINCHEKDGLEIAYKDNGDGITDASQLTGLGMINMQSRIESLNGKMILSSQEDSHFFAQISIPKK